MTEMKEILKPEIAKYAVEMYRRGESIKGVMLEAQFNLTKKTARFQLEAIYLNNIDNWTPVKIRSDSPNGGMPACGIAPTTAYTGPAQWIPDAAERNRVQVKLWEKNHPDKAAEKSARYAQLHPERMEAKKERRKAREIAAGPRFTQRQWHELCALFNWTCPACGVEKTLTPDHIVPLSKGGTNSIENIQPLCFTCNRQKSDRTIDYRGKRDKDL